MRKFSAALVIALSVVMGYVMLTAKLTSLNYAVARAQHQRAALQEETLRMDDRLSQLRSDDHLAALAAKLNMRDDERFVLVRVPVPHPRTSNDHVAFLSTISGWFGVK